jgi:hypothetical protein
MDNKTFNIPNKPKELPKVVLTPFPVVRSIHELDEETKQRIIEEIKNNPLNKLKEMASMQGITSSSEKTKKLKKTSRISLLDMAGNFTSAMKDFAKSGFLRVTEEQHAQRMEICNGCEFWQGDARMGMGKCLKCGCTGAKQWIATSVCPINKWGAISKEEIEASMEKENAQAQETQSTVSQQADGSSQELTPETKG